MGGASDTPGWACWCGTPTTSQSCAALFAGEPLARPYGAQTVEFESDAIVMETNVIAPRETWAVEAADSEDGPWTLVMDVSTDEWRRSTARVPRSDAAFLRLVRTD